MTWTVTTSATIPILTDSSNDSSTTSTSAAANDIAAAELVERALSLEASLFETLSENNLTTVTGASGGLACAVAKLNATAAAAEGSLTVALADTGVAATVPASLFAHLSVQNLVLAVTKVDLTAAGFSGNVTKSDAQVLAAVNVNVLSFPTGRRFDVADLTEPIKVAIPVGNSSSGPQCAFWHDDGSSSWATTGVETGALVKGVLECRTTHLTLFGAILRGFVDTLACSQVALLNAESVKQLGEGDWHRSTGVLALDAVVAMFLVLLLVGAWLDRLRSKQGITNDAHLLIPPQNEEAGARQEEHPEERLGERPEQRPEESPEEHPEERLEERQGERPEEHRKDGSGPCGCCARAASCLVDWCRSTVYVRDALDEVFSLWFDYFGEVRGLVEALGEALGEVRQLRRCGHPGAWFITCVDRLLRRSLVTSAQRQAATSVGVSWDTSSLVVEDELLTDVVQAHRRHRVQNPNPTVPLAREEAWGRLHRDLEAKLDEVFEAATHRSALPGTVWRLFLHQNVLSSCLVRCALTSCKMRVLFFAVEVAGALMLTTLFFSATGVPGKRSRSSCDFDAIAQFAGRIVAMGTATAVLAGVPVMILGSFCTRKVKEVAYEEGSPAWHKQLRVWRTQGKLVWILGSLYIGFSAFFNILFLANVSEEDHKGWLLSMLISFVMDLVLIPLTQALSLVFLTMGCLHLISRHRRATKEEVVSALHMEFKRGVNMNVAVGVV